MIRINKKPCPSQLTPEQQKSLLDKYVNHGHSVWKKAYIEKALLESSHGKCVYCECKLNVESKYMEVEHFHDKFTYPQEVINWDNLLPSCKRCNVHKANFDTKKNPFIDPSKMDPKQHLILNSFRFYPITLAGENTIEELLLNDHKKLVRQRFEIAEAVVETLKTIYERIIDYIEGHKTSNRVIKNIISAVSNLMDEATPKSEYAATVATTLLNNTNQFRLIEELLRKESLWNDELQQKLVEIYDISLDIDMNKSYEYDRNKKKY